MGFVCLPVSLFFYWLMLHAKNTACCGCSPLECSVSYWRSFFRSFCRVSSRFFGTTGLFHDGTGLLEQLITKTTKNVAKTWSVLALGHDKNNLIKERVHDLKRREKWTTK